MPKYVLGDQILPALGDDRIWNMSDEEFKAISDACGVKFNATQRNELSQLLLMHASNANAQMHRLKASEALCCLGDVTKASKGLLKQIRILRSAQGMTLELELAKAGFHQSELTSLQELLAHLSTASSAARQTLSKSTIGGRGRSKHPNLEQFVGRLAKLYEDAGGTVSTHYSDITGMRSTPFIRFVETLLNRMPDPLKKSQPALGQAVHRAVEVWRKGKAHNSK